MVMCLYMRSLLLKNLRKIITAEDTGYPNYGKQQSKLSEINDSSIFIKDGKIGKIEDYNNEADLVIDSEEFIALPGLIDSHTHIVYSGSRFEEFYQKIEGRTYLEILESGNGIGRTVRETESSSLDQLYEQTASRVKEASLYGTTTMEMKTGYASSIEGEKKMISVMERISSYGIVNVLKTLLPLHSVSMGKNSKEHVDFVISNLLPELINRVDFVDSFCDSGAFSPEETARFFDACGDKPKRLHSDEIANIGCLDLTDRFKILSADHLLKIESEGFGKLFRNKVTANILPITAFSLNERYPSGRKFIESEIPVSISTDSSPLTKNQNMQFAIYLAVRFCGLKIEEAINAATINAAYSLNIANRTGSIEAGKDADLILMKLSDYREIPYEYASNPVSFTIRGGNIL